MMCHGVTIHCENGKTKYYDRAVVFGMNHEKYDNKADVDMAIIEVNGHELEYCMDMIHNKMKQYAMAEVLKGIGKEKDFADFLRKIADDIGGQL
jgi:hypothetical protein